MSDDRTHDDRHDLADGAVPDPARMADLLAEVPAPRRNHPSPEPRG